MQKLVIFEVDAARTDASSFIEASRLMRYGTLEAEIRSETANMLEDGSTLSETIRKAFEDPAVQAVGVSLPESCACERERLSRVLSAPVFRGTTNRSGRPTSMLQLHNRMKLWGFESDLT